MLDSLRGRLLFWYTAMAGAVIAAFGTMVCYLAWRARWIPSLRVTRSAVDDLLV